MPRSLRLVQILAPGLVLAWKPIQVVVLVAVMVKTLAVELVPVEEPVLVQDPTRAVVRTPVVVMVPALVLAPVPETEPERAMDGCCTAPDSCPATLLNIALGIL